MPAYVAVDLGAESGRVVAGVYDGDGLDVREVHRFANRPLRAGEDLTWNLDSLYDETVRGLRSATEQVGGIRSVGIDSWGSDFGLLADDELVTAPWHHRTPRTTAMVRALQEEVEPQLLYDVTGTQFLPITTACQLLAMRETGIAERADRLAMLPDLIAWRLSGVPCTEQTIASTTQLWDIRDRTWATGVIDLLGFPRDLFRAGIVRPGTPLAELRTDLGSAQQLSVVAVAGHDTACAIAAVPRDHDDPVGFVSCGTWSLVGVETAEPITTSEARLAGFTNELGVDGGIRFLSNVNGLWLLQESRRVWASGGTTLTYAELTSLAARSAPFRSLIDTDHPSLLSPGDLPSRIAALCRMTGQPVPDGPGATARCVLDSLACKYRWVLERAGAMSGQPVRTVHVVGGGAANELLCQLTADVTGLPVIAGPVEATAIGNLLVQIISDGGLRDLREARELVRTTVPLRHHTPTNEAAGAADAYDRFMDVMARLEPDPAAYDTN